MQRRFRYIIVLCFAIVLLSSCGKKKDNLYSISISPSAMVGTAAESFSIVQIKMFAASNSFTCSLIPNICSDSNINNFAFAPFYFINNFMLDTNLSAWDSAYNENYLLSHHSVSQMKNIIQSFISTVKEIDSNVKIKSNIDFEDKENIFISQSMNLALPFNYVPGSDIDNIFTCYSGQKPRVDFITFTDTLLFSNNDERQVIEIPSPSGDYALMLVMPKEKNIKDYLRDFTEEEYLSLSRSLTKARIKLSLPHINLNMDSTFIKMPSYKNENGEVAFRKNLYLSSSFSISKVENGIAIQNPASDIVKYSNVKVVKYDSPFLFIVRGKSSNFIMFIGAVMEITKRK